MELPHHARAGAGGLPRLRSDARTANSLNRASFGSPGARQGQVLLDALPGRSRRRLLPAPRTKCSGLTAMSLASRCAVQRKRAPCYSCTSPMLSSPTLPSYFAAGVASVFSALHHMWKAWCKQGKKKCWFMVCCRERPAWWGALVKVDIPFKYSAQVERLHIWLSGRTTRQSCQSCLDSSRHFPSFVRI